jgi:hypothetical protein
MAQKEYVRPQGSLISFMSNKVKQYGGINSGIRASASFIASFN